MAARGAARARKRAEEIAVQIAVNRARGALDDDLRFEQRLEEDHRELALAGVGGVGGAGGDEREELGPLALGQRVLRHHRRHARRRAAHEALRLGREGGEQRRLELRLHRRRQLRPVAAHLAPHQHRGQLAHLRVRRALQPVEQVADERGLRQRAPQVGLGLADDRCICGSECE